MEFLKLILIVIVLLALAVFGLAIQIIFKKSHKFPNIHISRNKKMKENGITCAQSWDKSEQMKANTIK
jgi:hypothetical protein